MGAPDLNRRERKKEATRETLLEAALGLFEERGYSATTVEDIAERADVAPRTFFRYFANKAALLHPASEAALEQFRTELAARPPDEPLLDAVRHALHHSVEHIEHDRQRLLLLDRIRMEAGVDKGPEEFENLWITLEAEVARRLDVEPETDPRPTVVTGVAVGAAGSAHHRWLHGDPDVAMVDLIDDAFDTLRALVRAADPAN